MISNALPSTTPHGESTGAPLSPARLLLAVAWFVGVALMLAVIAQVAQAQVQKGQDFRFAEQKTLPAAPAPYASWGGADVSDLGERVSSPGALQTVGFTR